MASPENGHWPDQAGLLFKEIDGIIKKNAFNLHVYQPIDLNEQAHLILWGVIGDRDDCPELDTFADRYDEDTLLEVQLLALWGRTYEITDAGVVDLEHEFIFLDANQIMEIRSWLGKITWRKMSKSSQLNGE